MIYIGNNVVDSVNFASYYKEYDKDFTESVWEVNTSNGWEVEFTKTQAIIKKFKIDTWGIRRNIKTPTNVYNKYLSWVLDVSGLAYVNENIITFGKSYYPNSGYRGYNDATSFAPGKWPNDDIPTNKCYYVSGLIVQFGRGYQDMKDSVSYPSEQMLKHPWNVGNRVRISDGKQTGTEADTSYQTIQIGLYGGSQDSTSEDYYKIYDISEHPIILTLVPSLIDPQSRECWKIYYKNTIWEKEKTFENNWVKYKYVTEKTGSDKYWSLNNSSYDLKFKDPPIIDYNFVGEYNSESNTTLKPWVTFNYAAKDSSFWDPIKTYFANNKIVNPKCFEYTTSDSKPSLFANSNISGELTLNFSTAIRQMPDIISGTKVEKITINFEEQPKWYSCLSMFRHANSLKEIIVNKPLPASEMAGMFEFCTNLTTIPANLFRYENRNYTNNSHMCYTFEGCKNLVEIPMSSRTTDVYSEQNTINTETIAQAFNGCSKLERILPILNLAGCHPDNTYLAFYECAALTHVLIKNLNKGDWRFDGTSSKKLGTLTNLDEESVKYMLNNVCDIAHLQTEEESQNNSFKIGWTNQNTTYISRYVLPEQLNITCSLAVDTNVYIYNSSVNNLTDFYFLPQEKINASDMENYKIIWTVNGERSFADINSNGNSNYGFYIKSSAFIEDIISISITKPYNIWSSSVTTAKIYIPEVWKTDNRFTQDEIDVCNSRGWHIYIGNSEITTI